MCKQGPPVVALLNDSVLIVKLPNITELFPAANGDRDVAGYFPITVTHPSTSLPSQPVTVACPPACPGNTNPDGVSIAGGAYYMYMCDSYLTGSACLQLDTAKYCALGSGTRCSPCPTGGFCPGGFRLW